MSDFRPDCEFAKGAGQKKVCFLCAKPLEGRQQRWCGPEHQHLYWSNHSWNVARHAAIERDGQKCVKCGAKDEFYAEERPYISRTSLQVNHITPRHGRGYHNGCHHHLDGLETVCVPCHGKITSGQTLERNALPKSRWWVTRFIYRDREGAIAVHPSQNSTYRSQRVFRTRDECCQYESRFDIHENPLVANDKGVWMIAPVMLRDHEVEFSKSYGGMICLINGRRYEQPLADPETFALFDLCVGGINGASTSAAAS